MGGCVLVDDNEWIRRGLHQAVDEIEDFRCRSLDYETAATTEDWIDEDVLIFGSSDPTNHVDDWDRYPAVSIGRRIRLDRTANGERTTEARCRLVAIIDPRCHPVAQLRFIEAGFSQLVTLEQIRSMDTLRALLTDPEFGAPDLNRMYRDADVVTLGISRRSRLNDALDHIETLGLVDAFRDGPSGLTRRQVITARTRVTAAMRIEPVVAGTGVMVNRNVPSWQQLRTVVHHAIGFDLDTETARTVVGTR